MAPLTEVSRNFGQSSGSEPISRTMQYRKITKPLLERQRRARINRCLDELKDILINGLQAEGENVARLEKADILELTVRHLTKLQSQQKQIQSEQQKFPKLIGDDEKFRSGFAHCAQEVSRALASAVPRIDIEVGTSLMVHLGHSLNQISTSNSNKSSPASSPQTSPVLRTIVPKYSPISPVPSPAETSSYRPYTPPSSPEEYYCNGSYLESPINFSKNVWRPW